MPAPAPARQLYGDNHRRNIPPTHISYVHTDITHIYEYYTDTTRPHTHTPTHPNTHTPTHPHTHTPTHPSTSPHIHRHAHSHTRTHPRSQKPRITATSFGLKRLQRAHSWNIPGQSALSHSLSAVVVGEPQHEAQQCREQLRCSVCCVHILEVGWPVSRCARQRQVDQRFKVWVCGH